MSRTRNSAWNVAGGLIFALASAASSLLATPWLLRWLGAERLGAFKALTDWLGYLTFFELGLGGALMAALATKVGQGNQDAVVRMLAAGLRVYYQLTLVSFVGGVCLVLALPYVISPDNLSPNELRTAGAVCLLPLFLTPLLVFRALAEARQRGYISWLLLTAQVLVTTVLSLLTARLGWGLTGQGMAFAVAQVLPPLALAWDGARAYGGAWKASPGQEDRGVLWRLSWPTFVHMAADRIRLAADNILVAWILGPAAVVPFYLTQQLVTLAQFQLRGLGQATWAGLAELYARGDEARLRMRLLELTSLVSGLGLAVLAPIAAYNRFFIHLWVGLDAYAGEAVTVIACFNALIWSIYTLWGWVMLGTGHIRRWAPFTILSTLVNLVVSVIGTAMIGLVGPLLGTTTGFLLVTSWALPRALHQVLSIPPWILWRAALAPLRWGLPFALSLRAIASYHHPGGWLEFFAVVGLGSTGGLALWWRLSLESEERLAWRTRLRNVLLTTSTRER
jgi:O-antigen/teichoic acid export membrane protein